MLIPAHGTNVQEAADAIDTTRLEVCPSSSRRRALGAAVLRSGDHRLLPGDRSRVPVSGNRLACHVAPRSFPQNTSELQDAAKACLREWVTKSSSDNPDDAAATGANAGAASPEIAAAGNALP